MMTMHRFKFAGVILGATLACLVLCANHAGATELKTVSYTHLTLPTILRV